MAVITSPPSFFKRASNLARMISFLAQRVESSARVVVWNMTLLSIFASIWVKKIQSNKAATIYCFLPAFMFDLKLA